MILLSNVVQNAIIGNDLSITGAAIGAAMLVGVNSLANRLALRIQWFSRLFDGTETQVIKDGQVLPKALRRLGLRTQTLDHAVRMQNGDDVDQLDDGVMEPGGQLVLTLRAGEQSATKDDVARITAQLNRLEAALATRPSI